MSRTQTAVRAARVACRALAACGGLALAVPALAQEEPPPQPRTVTTVTPEPTTDREAAAQTMPTWEAFGESETESTTESTQRLARDFSASSELGVRKLGAVPIWPRGDLKIGPVRILPFLRQGLEYQSNHYRAHETGDRGSTAAHDASWTHVNQGGFLADAAFAGGRLRLAGSVDAEWDVRYDDGEDPRVVDANGFVSNGKKADTFELDSELGASYRWPSGAYVRSGVSYDRRADPIDVEFSQEFQRTNRGFFAVAGLDKDVIFGTKFRYQVGMNVRDVIGREDELDDLDRTETLYYGKLSYPFWRSTTRLFGRATYRQHERESTFVNDGNAWGLEGGIEGNVSLSEGEYRGLRGQISFGFEHTQYTDDTFDVGSTEIIRDENSEATNLTVNVTLEYLMSRKTSVDLRYLRLHTFTFHGNHQLTDRFDLTFNHAITPRLQGRVATFFEYDEPTGRLAQQVVGFDDTTGKYPATTRFGAGVGLRYRLNDWADLDCNFEWERRNNSQSGFVNHRAALGVTVYLNALKPRRAGEPSLE